MALANALQKSSFGSSRIFINIFPDILAGLTVSFVSDAQDGPAAVTWTGRDVGLVFLLSDILHQKNQSDPLSGLS